MAVSSSSKTIDLATEIRAMGARAREAARALAIASTEAKTRALKAGASEIRQRTKQILAANAEDIALARQSGATAAFLDRVQLDDKRIEGIARGLEDVAALPD